MARIRWKYVVLKAVNGVKKEYSFETAKIKGKGF